MTAVPSGTIRSPAARAREPSAFQVAWDIWRATRAGLAQIQARQRARLAELVAFARQHSAFYAERYRELPQRVDDLRQLPPVTKPELMARFDEWVTDPALRRADLDTFVADKRLIGRRFRGQYMVWTTSGTTGSPAIIVADRRWDTGLTAMSLARITPNWFTPAVLWGVLRTNGRSASLFATGGHFLGVTMAERQRMSRASRARRIKIIPVTLPVPELVRQLNDHQPGLFSGYTSAVALMADEQQAGRLRIHPALVIVSGETLAPGDKQRIETIFGCPVRDNYACSEAGVMAYACAQGTLHLNADWVILEPIDEQMRPVPPGQFSHAVLVTNLANRVQPIIRYQMGDQVMLLPEPCPCGNRLPALRIEGRTDEVLRITHPDGAEVPILPLALWSVIKETPGVYRFQAIQAAPKTLKIRLEAAPATDSNAAWEVLRQRVNAYLAQHGLTNVAVERAPEPPARDPQSGKFRHVWAELPRST